MPLHSHLKRDYAIHMTDSRIVTDAELFLPIRDVERMSGLRKTAIYRRISEGSFPASRRYIGSSRVFWLLSEIRTWQAQQLAAAA